MRHDVSTHAFFDSAFDEIRLMHHVSCITGLVHHIFAQVCQMHCFHTGLSTCVRISNRSSFHTNLGIYVDVLDMGGTIRIVEDLQPPLQGSVGFGCQLVSY